jgi:hypothetical protein
MDLWMENSTRPDVQETLHDSMAVNKTSTLELFQSDSLADQPCSRSSHVLASKESTAGALIYGLMLMRLKKAAPAWAPVVQPPRKNGFWQPTLSAGRCKRAGHHLINGDHYTTSSALFTIASVSVIPAFRYYDTRICEWATYLFV